MASLVNKLSLVFLLFVASSSLRIHARESRSFFMKTTRPEDPKEAPTIPPVQGLSGSGYGLYGHGQEQFAPTTTTTYNNNNYYNNNARPNANTFPSSFPDAKLTSESYDNGGYNYDNNSPSKFSNEELGTRSYETKEYNYVGSKQYGMSDTRYLENGRYFYDVNAETNRNKYGTYPTRGNPQAGARAGSHGNGVYGNGNAYEYNNAMKYQNNQMNQEISREEYVP
ncbi:protein E6-like [Cocos nucifera]|uniref:Protein E6-like n=1 Tax=Cocos nucifera TaxID=13894 RepID=A0A8K0N2P4_COCNU|nr:protein E6-like [Cocos nucifera]